MANRSNDEKDIASIVKKLSEENKRYVVAVANALLFTQEKEKQSRHVRGRLSVLHKKESFENCFVLKKMMDI